jgi:hypothetical protein
VTSEFEKAAAQWLRICKVSRVLSDSLSRQFEISMSDSANPYQPPVDVKLAPASRSPGISLMSMAAWPFWLGANLIIPVLFGLQFTGRSGRWGMAFAIVLFLIGGWCVCYSSRKLGRYLNIGAAILSFTQIFPLLQVVAGMFGVWVAVFIGCFQPATDIDNAEVLNELGGFVVTSIVGCILLSVALFIGLIVVTLLTGTVFPADEHPSG